MDYPIQNVSIADSLGRVAEDAAAEDGAVYRPLVGFYWRGKVGIRGLEKIGGCGAEVGEDLAVAVGAWFDYLAGE